ncbi:SLBB domain-containing protein [Niabella hibiscisoli]|uniref:SLBB domain-containing protein n=1 Tax=Niabella hibiscisoli TaxID=1825928 RepID=UPI001F0ED870|nr:SLBB domain-containing protein [Niabella hibiscisoli]MCH5719971.1 SLBB domain-containing protein [Niabella hibiscisoli]
MSGFCANAQSDPKGQTPTTSTSKDTKTSSQVPGDLGNIKVDNMSDAQVQQMMQRIGGSGLSEAQLEQAATARGMDAMEIQKLKDRMSKLSGSNNNKESQDRTRQVAENDTTQPVNNVARRSRIFGSELFSSGFTSFEPNLRIATPANYVIGPDDVLLLDLTGDNEASYKLPVSPEGSISLEYVGRISVGGLTIEQAKSKLRSQMSGTYPGLNSGRTQLALNLGNIRSIKVIITGEVTKPGTYTLPSVASVFNALYASGGPSQNGSFRNIELIRGNRVVANIDLYDFLINGVQNGNVRLQDQDVIRVPVYQVRVDVLGEVKRSAIYEIRPDESLVDVLKYAGGFSDKAYKARVKIIQNTANAQKIIVQPLTEFPNYSPKNGDKVFVDPIFERFENSIQIVGAVGRAGMYEYKPGLTLTQLIQQADGLTPDVFMNRGYIIRMNADNTTSVVSFDVAQAMRGGGSDIVLKKDDVIQISSIFDLRDEQTVSIAGEVRNPGTFSYADNLTVETIIQMAGGFKEGGSPVNIEVSRRVKTTDLTQKTAQVAQVFTVQVSDSLSLQEASFALQPYDMVSVRAAEGYSTPKQVQILGEVLRPGIYTIQSKNERISDVIKRAGGLTAFAYTEGASLKRPSTSNTLNVNDEPIEDSLQSLNLKRLNRNTSADAAAGVSLSSDLVGIKLEQILSNPQSRFDLILEEGDVIKIPTMLQTVKVSGEVLRPINVVYVPGRPFKYYVNSAGGFTSQALKRGAFISHANGSVEGTRKAVFFNKYPGIKPGAEILVPQKPIKDRMSAQAWIGIGTGVASLAALIFAILRP